jgi:2-methylisocitrate lyase-like PEP mutase family enzyme
MVDQKTQAVKAEQFRAQHLDEKLLILPNIWDALGARLIQQIGFPSVATASVATALSNGFPDGEHIPFSELLIVVKKISSAVDLPLTVDIERGFANTIPELKENIFRLIEHGAIGINIEDSHPDHKGLNSIDEQCRKIEAIREVTIQCGVPLVINARTDAIFLKIGDNPVADAIERARAFKKSGADCVYPILINKYDDITRFVEEVEMPINVVLLKPISDLQYLEKIGVARVSIGPNLLNHVLTVMKTVTEGLKNYDSSAFFGRELLPREYLNQLAKF